MSKSSRRTPRKSLPAATTAAGERSDPPGDSDLYQRAQAQLKNSPKPRPVRPKETSDPDVRRLLHELQIHQIEVEIQNSSLEETRQALQQSLECYTDLYECAPVAYYTLDSEGTIQQVNLAATQLVDKDRNHLIGRPFARCLVPGMRPRFKAFLKTAFESQSRQTGEFAMQGNGVPTRFVSINAESSANKTACRLVAVDITDRIQSEEARLRLEVLAASNRKLELEISRREQSEQALYLSERHQRSLLRKSKRLQDELRRMSHLILEAQEEERRRISRELHDHITQTLINISFHLQSLSSDAEIAPHQLMPKILQTQRLVEQSVDIVHHFARDLRPPALDHLGLIPALEGLLAEFIERTNIQTQFVAFPEIETISSGRRIAIYRVIQSALSNVAKHSKAATVTVKLQKVARAIHLTIIDNGKSFDKKQLRYAKGDRRLGLLGMRERVEMVGGSFEVRGAPGHGTTVEARIPLADPTPRKPEKTKPPASNHKASNSRIAPTRRAV